MNNVILKVTDGDLFNFFDSESRKSFIIGSKRTCDLVVKSTFVAAEQLRCICKDGVWYVEDITPEGSKSEVLIGGKRFRRPVVRLDNDIVIRKTGDKRSKEGIRISVVKKISRRRSGGKIDLTQKTITVVGRNPSCDIVQESPLVSEKHFRIIYDGKDFFIEDLRSINGTYVNNRKIHRAQLKDYDRISIPSAAYIFFDKKLLFSTSAAGIQIDVAGVSKEVPDRYSEKGKAVLVKNVTFRIKAGDFVAIVGGSGTGKSTMLDCINGIRPATGGSIYYDTNNYYENIRSYKEVIGYVPQKDIMHDDLTVEEGLFYTAMLRMRSSMFRDEVKQRVTQAIADVKLTGREKVKISSLSGGQRKRVSIAMELLSDPKVIFLDEPTSGLSPDLDLEMMELLRELAEKGRTIVVITHSMENLDKCDKIAFLGKGGRLCFYGRHDEVFRYFNRKSYSRIFAALNEEKTCEYFEKKYRSTEYYKKLYAEFTETYGDKDGDILPPVTRSGQEAAPAQSAPSANEASDGNSPSTRRGARKKVRKPSETAAENVAAEDESAAARGSSPDDNNDEATHAPIQDEAETTAESPTAPFAERTSSENVTPEVEAANRAAQAHYSDDGVFDVIPESDDADEFYFVPDGDSDEAATDSATSDTARQTEEAPGAEQEPQEENAARSARATGTRKRANESVRAKKNGVESSEKPKSRKSGKGETK